MNMTIVERLRPNKLIALFTGVGILIIMIIADLAGVPGVSEGITHLASALVGACTMLIGAKDSGKKDDDG